eukprot:14390447-Alexandrium_andersonii.AAC.1
MRRLCVCYRIGPCVSYASVTAWPMRRLRVPYACLTCLLRRIRNCICEACVPYACRMRALVLELHRSKPARALCVSYASATRSFQIPQSCFEIAHGSAMRSLCLRYAFAKRSLCVP